MRRGSVSQTPASRQGAPGVNESVRLEGYAGAAPPASRAAQRQRWCATRSEGHITPNCAACLYTGARNGWHAMPQCHLTNSVYAPRYTSNPL